MVKCPMDKTKGSECNQEQTSGQIIDVPKKNRFYSLKYRGYQEDSPNVVTGMLKVFSINVYALLDPNATLCFVTPLVSMKFDVILDVLVEPFSISTTVGDSIFSRRVYESCPILFSNSVTMVDFVILDMLDFDVISGMDWLNACFATIDC